MTQTQPSGHTELGEWAASLLLCQVHAHLSRAADTFCRMLLNLLSQSVAVSVCVFAFVVLDTVRQHSTDLPALTCPVTLGIAV